MQQKSRRGNKPEADVARRSEIERQLLRRLANKYGPNGHRDRMYRFSPFLIIPKQLVGGYFWENLSIGMSSEPPVVGVPNLLSVVIRNCGPGSAFATVAEFRWGKPSLGLDERHLHSVGKSIPTHIEKGRQNTIHSEVPWIPTVSGHQCLMVTCWASNQPVGLQPWQPQTELRCAQRNVTVAAMKANTSMKLELDFSNLLPIRTVHTVLASVERVTAPRRLLEQIPKADVPLRVLDATIASRTFRASAAARLPLATDAAERGQQEFLAERTTLGVRSQLSGGRGTIGSTGARESMAGLLMAADRLPMTLGCSAASTMSVLHEVSLHEAELRNITVELQVPQDLHWGDFLVYRLAQVAENMLLGGYTVILQVE